MSWGDALSLTLSQARAILAACQRRDSDRALLAMRCTLAAGAALNSKQGHTHYRKFEQALESATQPPIPPPDATTQARRLGQLARAAGAQPMPTNE